MPFVILALSSYGLATAERRPEEVRVRVGDIALAGLLHRPAGTGPFPAVVLIHGSEPGRKDGRGYVRFAEALNERGIAALSSDKRGVGDSGGEYVEAPDLNLPAGDMLTWIDMLKQREDIDPNSIGVLGWSQGGWIGPLVASRSDDVAFVVSISGSGVSPLEQNIFDKTNQFRAQGATRKQTQQFSRVIRLVWTYLARGEDREEAQAAWDSVEGEEWFTSRYQGPPMMDRDVILKHPRMTHFEPHSCYDPAVALSRVRVPMLAVFGGDDRVVPVERSIRAMSEAFGDRAADLFEHIVFDGADHSIQVISPDGTRSFAVGYPDYVFDWIERITR